MPKVTVTLEVLVTLDVPEEFASKVTRDDLHEMAQSALPDSGVHPNNLPNGVQVIVDNCAQEDASGHPEFADVYHVEHNICAEPSFEFEDEGFTKADR